MNLTQQIKQGSWYKQAGNCKAYYIFTCCKAAMKCLGDGLGIWTFTNGKYIEAFLPKQSFLNQAKNHLEIQQKNPQHIVDIMKECDKKGNLLYNYYRELDIIGKMNLKEVQNALKKLDILNYQYWYAAYFCDFYDPTGEEILAEKIKEYSIQLSEKELNIFMKSNWHNFMQEEQLALLKIKKENKADLAKAGLACLINHANKFFYVNNSWESTTILKPEDFLKRLNEIQHPDAQIRLLNTNWEEEQAALQRKYNLPDELMNIFFYFRQLFIIRDKRKKHTLLSNHYYDQLFMRLSELLKIPFEDMRVLLVEEVTGDLKDLGKIISIRKNLFLEVYSNGNCKVISGGKAARIFNLLQKNYGVSKSLTGKGASKGRASGIARIILGETHFSKFNEGEILVAPMTRPEFVPLMKKAIAIVTDEGGITCHAAIISRELGIPCIVGTQKATTQLKDGMFIEVNADKGLVKVLKHMKLLTVQSLVNKELEKNSEIIKLLNEGLINITALAEKFKPMIAQQLGKNIDVNVIGMAIRRYEQKNKSK